jgi:hypothetical protein
MLKSINDGNFYIKNRNNQEQKLKKNENGIEGFDVISRQFQQKHSSKFDIPSNADPGQTVMCQVDKIRYVRLSQQNKHLTVQEVEVYDENGKNVALAGSFSNNYQLTKGKCRNTNGTTVTNRRVNKGNLTVQQCEDKCAQDKSCSAYEIQSEESTEGINPNCWTYRGLSVTGNGDPNEMCRVRERLPGTPTATMSAIYPNTNPYMAIDGKHDPRQKWPNSACTFKEGGWWELDLGKLVNVKKIVIYNRPDSTQQFVLDRLNGATVSLIDRDHNTVWTKTLNSNRRQEFPVKFSNQNCGGPVIEKNMDDFEVLKELQIKYYKELQLYNQAVKDLVENSRDYVNASNMNNNKFHNKYVRESNGAVGYVTDRGVWKSLSNPTIANSIQGQNGCPSNWRSNSEPITPDEGQEYSIRTAPIGNIIKMDGQELIKGSNMIQNQSCSNAGQNLYVTEPSIPTAPQYLQCSRNVGSYQSDLGTTTFNRCKQRAADEGSNVFSMGPNEGNSKGKCYIGGGGGRIVKDSICPVAPGVGRMGGKVRSRRKGFKKIRGYYVFATYETENANNSNLGDTFHITDNLTKKQYWAGNVKDSTEFQMIPGYGSRGNDITSGSGLSIEQIKQKCLDTPNSAGFTFNVNNGKYYIKNKNMWPRGTRHATSNAQLYIRLPSVLNDISCSNEVKPTASNNIISYPSDGRIAKQTTCGLGTIAKRDYQSINNQHQKLTTILIEIKQKIQELSRTDLILNQRLLSEYTTLENRLKKYEQVYREINREKTLMSKNSAFEEDTELNMLSYNKQYIIWSILALGATFGAMKIMK